MSAKKRANPIDELLSAANNSEIVFRNDAEEERYKRHKKICYRNLIVKSLLTFLLGLFFCFLLQNH